MKRNLLTLIIPVLLFACVQTAPGQMQKEERNVATFTSVDLAISANVYLTQGSAQKVVVEASDEDLKKVVTEVSNGHLKIKTDGWRVNLKTVNVYITLSDLEGIGLSGSGNITADGAFKCGSLDLAISGSGNIKMDNLTATKVETAISGSGNISLAGSGKAESLEIAISGSGDVNAENFECGKVAAHISGSGNCRVNASDTLEGHVSGSGDIYYKGKARLDIRISGSGKARSI